MSKLDAEPQTNPHPEHVGRFRIKRLLGMGSMGAVFLAEDPVIHREVAIKTLNVNLTAQEARMFEETFLNEARAAGRLNHPHIVTVYDAGRIDGVSYIAMEYLKGVELKELIARGEEFTMKQVAEIFIRVADALQYAHDNGIVHRDIKPANIFLTAKTNPKVLDFGIAQAATSFSQSFMPNPFGKNLVGTPNYMSPELLLGQPLDGRSDIFSLGVVMYEVLTRQVPFRGSTFEDLTRAICTAHPTPPQDINPEVPLPIAKIVAKALAKSPGERYQSARELADDLPVGGPDPRDGARSVVVEGGDLREIGGVGEDDRKTIGRIRHRRRETQCDQQGKRDSRTARGERVQQTRKDADGDGDEEFENHRGFGLGAEPTKRLIPH